MNNPLSTNQLGLLAQTLGGRDSTKWYRNHFVASIDHPDLPALRELEVLGLMQNVPSLGFVPGGIIFSVTDKGKNALKNTTVIENFDE